MKRPRFLSLHLVIVAFVLATSFSNALSSTRMVTFNVNNTTANEIVVIQCGESDCREGSMQKLGRVAARQLGKGWKVTVSQNESAVAVRSIALFSKPNDTDELTRLCISKINQTSSYVVIEPTKEDGTGECAISEFR